MSNGTPLDQTARGGADWTLPLAVPDKGQTDIRQFLKAGLPNISFAKNAPVKNEDEKFDKMRMIKNKMSEARRALDRDEAKNNKVQDQPIEFLNGERVVYAKDVDNARVQDQGDLAVV